MSIMEHGTEGALASSFDLNGVHRALLARASMATQEVAESVEANTAELCLHQQRHPVTRVHGPGDLRQEPVVETPECGVEVRVSEADCAIQSLCSKGNACARADIFANRVNAQIHATIRDAVPRGTPIS